MDMIFCVGVKLDGPKWEKWTVQPKLDGLGKLDGPGSKWAVLSEVDCPKALKVDDPKN